MTAAGTGFSFLALVAVDLLMAAVYLLFAHRSTSDLPAFAFWTAAFAAMVVGLGHVLTSSTHVKLRSTFVALLVGLAIGYFYAVAVSWLLRGWFRAFSLPVVVLWMASGGAYLAFAVSPWVNRQHLLAKFTPLVVMNLVLVLVLHAGGIMAERFVLKKRRLILVFAEYTSTEQPLHFLPDSSSDEEIKSLTSVLSKAQSSIRGELRITHCVVDGNGIPSTAIVIFPKEFLSQTNYHAQLRQPFGDTVIYRLAGDNWLRIPPNAPTSGREIILYRRPGEAEMLYEFQDNYGDGIGGPVEAPSRELRQCPKF